MANECWYYMVVTGRKEDIERLYSIMEYEDRSFYIYRVFSAELTSLTRIEEDLYYAQITGNVAWSCAKWVEHQIMTREEPCEKGADLYTDLLFLSELLHLNIEIVSEEGGIGFQEHYVIIDGELEVEQCTDWFEPYFEGGNDDELDDAIDNIKNLCKKQGILPHEREEFLKRCYKILYAGDTLYLNCGGFDRAIDPVALANGEYCAWNKKKSVRITN